AVVRFEIFDSRPRVENDDAFTGSDFPSRAKHFQSCKAGCAFGTDEETFICSDLTRDADHFLVIDGNRTAIGLTKNFQHQEIADRFWNAQAGSNRVRVVKFRSVFLSSLECANDWRAAGSLHREHSRPVFPDPAERFHFVEGFPHPDETSAAASRIKNH